MKQSITKKISMIVVCACSVCIMLLFAACGSIPTSTGSPAGAGNTTSSSIIGMTGIIQSVNTQAGSVTIVANVNGQSQQYTIGGLNSPELVDLQQHIGKVYTFQVAQNGNDYTITGNTTPQETDNAPEGTVISSTPTTENPTTGPNEPGSISFIGKVQSSNANSISVMMPNGSLLSMSITPQTDRGDFTTQISQGQQIKVKAVTNATDGNLIATKLSMTDNSDLQDMNTVDFTGITTSAVGSDNVVHFKVGNKTYNFAAGSVTIMKDFSNLQSIGNNQAIQISVLFNGSNSTITKISNGND